MKEGIEQESPRMEKKSKLIKPLKDFKFCHGKDVYDLKKGKEVKVPGMFLANLKTEKVIK